MPSLQLLQKINEYYSDQKAAGIDLPSGLFGMKVRAVLSFLIYGTSFSEYFGYRFWRFNHRERLTFMTRRHMFRFFDRYNPKQFRSRIGDKSQSAAYYGHLMNREQFRTETGKEAFEAFCKRNQNLFIKKKVGWGGDGSRIERVDTAEETNRVWNSLSDDDLVEPCLENCAEIQAIYSDSLNTIKVTVLVTKNGPEIQTALFRLGNNTAVDNVHAGGIAAAVDVETGTVVTAAMDKHFRSFYFHPVTGKQIIGFTIPSWEQVRKLALEAAAVTPQLRYTSWDIAVTKNGPVLIEGNWDAEFYAEQELLSVGNRKRYIAKLEGKTL